MTWEHQALLKDLADTWSQILSGCPSLTDSDVNRNVSADIVAGTPKSATACACARRPMQGSM